MSQKLPPMSVCFSSIKEADLCDLEHLLFLPWTSASSFQLRQPLLEALGWAKAAQAWGWVDQGLGGLGRNGGSLDHLWQSLLHRMIPKEQKGPVMTTMGDLTEPGKVDPALEHSSDPMLSCSQAAATQACCSQV